MHLVLKAKIVFLGAFDGKHDTMTYLHSLVENLCKRKHKK